MTIDKVEEFEMGRVISRTFSVLTRNAVIFLTLSAFLNVPTLLVTLYNARNNPLITATVRTTDPAARAALIMGQAGQVFVTSMVTLLISLIFAFVLQAALVQGTITDLNGEKASLGNCLSTGFKSFPPLIAIAILVYFGILFGAILLVVPGIIIGLMWSVAVPVKVVEQIGVFESLGRSRALTKGARWQLLGLFVIYFLIAIVFGLVVGLLFGVSLLRVSEASLSPIYLTAEWLIRIPLTALLAVGIASIYYELRLVKEGVGPQQLAAAFD